MVDLLTFNICSDPRFGKLGPRVHQQIRAIKLLQPQVICLQELALPTTRTAYYAAFHEQYFWCEPNLRPYQWIHIHPPPTIGLLIYCWMATVCWWSTHHWLYLSALGLILPYLLVCGLHWYEQFQFRFPFFQQPHDLQPGVNWTGLAILLRKDMFVNPMVANAQAFRPKGYSWTVVNCLKHCFLQPSFMVVHAQRNDGATTSITNCHLVDGSNHSVRHQQFRHLLQCEHQTSSTSHWRVCAGDFNTTSANLLGRLRAMHDWTLVDHHRTGCGGGIDHILWHNPHGVWAEVDLLVLWSSSVFSDHQAILARWVWANVPSMHRCEMKTRCQANRPGKATRTISNGTAIDSDADDVWTNSFNSSPQRTGPT
jgi:hypothetical protein